MKKLDKLILQSFIGPFILTFLVVVFILLTQYMLKYFEEFVGKDLGFNVFAELIMYFSINMTPVALPLAVLLSSLMTFGNLGEHFELTAIKSSGISLIRILLPLFVFVCIVSVLAFFSNNYIVPKANLNAYSLLYDIKQTKPSLDLKEGAFYNGIPNYSIKVNKKFPDGETLGDLIIYDHSAGQGNTKVILADSGKMMTIHNNTYLLLELYNGNSYTEIESKGSRIGKNTIEDFHRNSFDESKIVLSLASFGLKETKKELFASNKLMLSATQLTADVDSMKQEALNLKYEMFSNLDRYFSYHLKNKIKVPEELIPNKISEVLNHIRPDLEVENPDSANMTRAKYKSKDLPNIKAKKTPIVPKKNLPKRDKVAVKKPKKKINTPSKFYTLGPSRSLTNTFDLDMNYGLIKTGLHTDSVLLGYHNVLFNSHAVMESAQITLSVEETKWAKFDSIYQKPNVQEKVVSQALSQARYIKNNVSMQATRIKTLDKNINTYIIEKNKKFSQAVACIIMFLIGAPLGAIIKKGGLGIPVIISVCFFIVSYVLSITGEKWGKEGIIDPVFATWISNILLLPFGLVFLQQARNDVRVFESDFYKVMFDKIKIRLQKMFNL